VEDDPKTIDLLPRCRETQKLKDQKEEQITRDRLRRRDPPPSSLDFIREERVFFFSGRGFSLLCAFLPPVVSLEGKK
jgi:hypothetical protein